MLCISGVVCKYLQAVQEDRVKLAIAKWVVLGYIFDYEDSDIGLEGYKYIAKSLFGLWRISFHVVFIGL
jgi:hypothetical protein